MSNYLRTNHKYVKNQSDIKNAFSRKVENYPEVIDLHVQFNVAMAHKINVYLITFVELCRIHLKKTLDYRDMSKYEVFVSNILATISL